ncbi:MAG: ferrous iron transporter B, partial [Candidatus Omnitrophota bacterium]
MLVNFAKKIGYDDPLEICLSRIEEFLLGDYFVSKRSIALLLLQGDGEALKTIREKERERFSAITVIIKEAEAHYTHPLIYIISLRRQKEASIIANNVVSLVEGHKVSLKERVSSILMNPFMGGPILIAVLYYGLYKFVGSFGAGVLVNFLENKVFSQHVNPFMVFWAHKIIPLH